MDIKTITGVIGIGSGRKTHVVTANVITLQEWFDTFYKDLDTHGNRCYKDFRGNVICADSPHGNKIVEDAIVEFKERLTTGGAKYFLISYDGYLCGNFKEYVTYDGRWICDLPQPTELNVTCKKCSSKMGIK